MSLASRAGKLDGMNRCDTGLDWPQASDSIVAACQGPARAEPIFTHSLSKTAWPAFPADAADPFHLSPSTLFPERDVAVGTRVSEQCAPCPELPLWPIANDRHTHHGTTLAAGLQSAREAISNDLPMSAGAATEKPSGAVAGSQPGLLASYRKASSSVVGSLASAPTHLQY